MHEQLSSGDEGLNLDLLAFIHFNISLPLIQEGLFTVRSVTSKSMCTKYWLTAYLVKLTKEKSVVSRT